MTADFSSGAMEAGGNGVTQQMPKEQTATGTSRSSANGREESGENKTFSDAEKRRENWSPAHPTPKEHLSKGCC